MCDALIQANRQFTAWPDKSMGCQSGQKAKYSMKTKIYIYMCYPALNFELCTYQFYQFELCTCSSVCAHVLSVWVVCMFSQFELCAHVLSVVHKLREHVHSSKLRDNTHSFCLHTVFGFLSTIKVSISFLSSKLYPLH